MLDIRSKNDLDPKNMSETPEWLSNRMLEEGQKTVEFFHSLSTDQLEIEIYADGSRWKVRQLPAHFLSTEVGIFRLIFSILDGGPGVPENFDIDRYNEKQVSGYRDQDVADILEKFIEQRRSNARFTSNMTPDDLQKEGRHPYLGIVQVSEFIKLLYRHNQIHQRDIRRVLSIRV
jgi:DinB superfamily